VTENDAKIHTANLNFVPGSDGDSAIIWSDTSTTRPLQEGLSNPFNPFYTTSYSIDHAVAHATNTCDDNGAHSVKTSVVSAEVVLSDEDREIDAINRIPGINTWGDYTPCVLSCCRTAYELRGAGVTTFEYIEARFKIIGTGHGANKNVIAKAIIERAVFGSGAWADYQTVEVDGTSDPLGNIDIDMGVLPNDQGYQTRVKSCATRYGSL
jgi:hypothetical protein